MRKRKIVNNAVGYLMWDTLPNITPKMGARYVNSVDLYIAHKYPYAVSLALTILERKS